MNKPRPFIAIAAMSLNRVIGRRGALPWRLPEDFQWFKETTMGHVLLMGRKTFESIGGPLPGRETVVLTRKGLDDPGVKTVASLDAVEAMLDGRKWFVCGGEEIYRQTLNRCSDIYLTLVKRTVEGGDAFFPEFEEEFQQVEQVKETGEFKILHYRNRRLLDRG